MKIEEFNEVMGESVQVTLDQSKVLRRIYVSVGRLLQIPPEAWEHLKPDQLDDVVAIGELLQSFGESLVHNSKELLKCVRKGPS